MNRARRQRKEPHLKQLPKVLVVCEDSKSSLQYLDAASTHYRVPGIEIEFCGHTDPDGIVKFAISQKRKYEEVYCLIDRDRHTNFQQAIDRANGNDIEVIVSYPCFEFWLLLHFTYSRKDYVEVGNKSPADCVVRDLKQVDELMSDYDKGSNVDYFSLLLDRLETAEKNAEKTIRAAADEDEVNPSTYVHHLLARIKKLSCE